MKLADLYALSRPVALRLADNLFSTHNGLVVGTGEESQYTFLKLNT